MSHPPANPPSLINTLRSCERDMQRAMLEEAGVHESLASCPAVSAAVGDAARMVCEAPRAVLRALSPTTGKWTNYLVVPRSLQDDRMVLLMGVYVHVGVRCRVLLRRSDQKPAQLAAIVTSCRHVGGRMHEVIVILDQPVSAGEYRGADNAPIRSCEEESAVPAVE